MTTYKEIDKESISYKVARIDLLSVLESDIHVVRVYKDRLAIWRKDGQRLYWDELQKVKEDIAPGTIAIEYYPPSYKVVNKRHTRHLWFVDDIKHKHPEFLRK
jgi:hypothetical protein